MAVQIAKVLGAEVTGVCGTAQHRTGPVARGGPRHRPHEGGLHPEPTAFRRHPRQRAEPPAEGHRAGAGAKRRAHPEQHRVHRRPPGRPAQDGAGRPDGTRLHHREAREPLPSTGRTWMRSSGSSNPARSGWSSTRPTRSTRRRAPSRTCWNITPAARSPSRRSGAITARQRRGGATGYRMTRGSLRECVTATRREQRMSHRHGAAGRYRIRVSTAIDKQGSAPSHVTLRILYRSSSQAEGCGLPSGRHRQADAEPVAPSRAQDPGVVSLAEKYPSGPAPGQSKCAGHPRRPGPWRTVTAGQDRGTQDVQIIKHAALLRGGTRPRRGEHPADARSPARQGRRLGGRDAAPGAGPRPHRRGHDRPRGAPAVLRGARSRNGTGADGRSSGSREGPDAVGELDLAIRDIRNVVFDLRQPDPPS